MTEEGGTSGASTHVQRSLLGPSEKRLLVWVGERLPSWVGPDTLTILGLVGMAIVGVAYYLSGREPLWLIVASAGLVINWFGDSMDGTIARVRHKQRPKYGYYMDHLVDAFGTAFMLFGLAYSGLMSHHLGIVVLTLYLIMSINAYLATQTLGEFRISYGGLSPTEARIFLILVNTLLIYTREVTILGYHVRILDMAGVIGLIAILTMILMSAMRNLRRLDRQERAAWTADPAGDESREEPPSK